MYVYSEFIQGGKKITSNIEKNMSSISLHKKHIVQDHSTSSSSVLISRKRSEFMTELSFLLNFNRNKFIGPLVPDDLERSWR